MQRSGEFLWHQILTLKRHPEGWVTRDGIGLSGATTLQKNLVFNGFFIFFLSFFLLLLPGLRKILFVFCSS